MPASSPGFPADANVSRFHGQLCFLPRATRKEKPKENFIHWEICLSIPQDELATTLTHELKSQNTVGQGPLTPIDAAQTTSDAVSIP